VLCSDEESLHEAIERADARLYAAKRPCRTAVDRERAGAWIVTADVAAQSWP
jgi:hypothetical protein